MKAEKGHPLFSWPGCSIPARKAIVDLSEFRENRWESVEFRVRSARPEMETCYCIVKNGWKFRGDVNILGVLFSSYSINTGRLEAGLPPAF